MLQDGFQRPALGTGPSRYGLASDLEMLERNVLFKMQSLSPKPVFQDCRVMFNDCWIACGLSNRAV